MLEVYRKIIFEDDMEGGRKQKGEKIFTKNTLKVSR